MLKTNRSLVALIFLSIITCGIYELVFMWKVCKDLNTACGNVGKKSPNFIVVLLLSAITLGIYMWVWYYNQGNRIQDACAQYGVPVKENGTSYILWMLLGALLCGIGTLYGMYLFIKNINTLCAAYNNRFFPQQQPQYYAPQPQQPQQ